MSGERVSFAGLSEWRSKLAKLTEALGEITGGSLITEAAPLIADRVRKIATPTVERHTRSGFARSGLKVYVSGPIIKLDVPGYVRLHGWFPFRRGMPMTVLKFAGSVMAAKYMDAIGDEVGAARAIAEGIVTNDADQAAATFKAETARIARRMFRESEAGKAARKAAAAARRAAKKAAK